MHLTRKAASMLQPSKSLDQVVKGCKQSLTLSLSSAIPTLSRALHCRVEVTAVLISLQSLLKEI